MFHPPSFTSRKCKLYGFGAVIVKQNTFGEPEKRSALTRKMDFAAFNMQNAVTKLEFELVL